MCWFRDMGRESMVAVGDHVRAVGWLSSDRPFARTEVSAEFVARLREFVRLANRSADALSFPAFAGWHTCEFCGKVHRFGNFGAPSGPALFVAPEMVGHYVELHGYTPPPELVAAVLASPLPDTPEYRAAVAGFRQLHERWWQAMLRPAEAAGVAERPRE
jgi:hypothetical protein